MPFIVACALFLFLGGEGGNARPLGGRRKRETARWKEETQPR